MSYATIILHVRAGPEGAASLAAAVDLARRFGAALVGVGAEMFPPLVYDTGYASVSGDIYVALREGVERDLAAAHAAFREATAELRKPALWEAGLRQPAPAVALASRAADLIVAAPPPPGRADPFRHAAPAELAMSAGRPVFVVAPDGGPLKGQRIVVAWKDTRESRRALTDALPFLGRAQEVLVLEVCDKAEVEDASLRTHDVADALARHGCTARSLVVPSTGDDGAAILHQASLFGADLVVAGAYGHSRLGEWAFGGVTQALLAQTTTHLLLSH